MRPPACSSSARIGIRRAASTAGLISTSYTASKSIMAPPAPGFLPNGIRTKHKGGRCVIPALLVKCPKHLELQRFQGGGDATGVACVQLPDRHRRIDAENRSEVLTRNHQRGFAGLDRGVYFLRDECAWQIAGHTCDGCIGTRDQIERCYFERCVGAYLRIVEDGYAECLERAPQRKRGRSILGTIREKYLSRRCCGLRGGRPLRRRVGARCCLWRSRARRYRFRRRRDERAFDHIFLERRLLRRTRRLVRPDKFQVMPQRLVGTVDEPQLRTKKKRAPAARFEPKTRCAFAR